MSVKSKVGSKLSGVAKHADMLGALVGYLGTFGSVFTAEGRPYFEALIARHYNMIKIHNVKNIEKIPGVYLANDYWNPIVFAGAAVGIAGWIGSYLPSVVPWQKSLTSFAKKAGFGAAVGGLAAVLVGALSDGSGGSTIDGSSNAGTSSGNVSSTGRLSRPTGAFTPPSPYVGTWAKPR